MSLSSVKWDPRRDCHVWGLEDEEFFPVGMEMEKKVPLERFGGWGRNFIPRPAETP
ncbi:hypothetical protein A2U01_0068799, partial [Trifolium medium]|nr:hypothetical protein [Trifolium medium]